jgi:glyoxylase-like metal-dependent hydrolase (beta-lactamase superfamily II)
MRAAPADQKRFFQGATVSLTPYIRRGRMKLFEGDRELIPGVRAMTGYGHTPGHTMYVVESRGEKLLLWGDIVHVAAVQFPNPSVAIAYDVIPEEAKHTREIGVCRCGKERLFDRG